MHYAPAVFNDQLQLKSPGSRLQRPLDGNP